MNRRMIPRSEWGATLPNGKGTRTLPATIGVAHHSVTIAPDLLPPFDDDYAAMRVLERVGHERFGQGISYSRVISPSGLIFEGLTADAVGSHTANMNSRAMAYCVIGNTSTHPLTAIAMNSIAWTLAYDHRHGFIDRPAIDYGHRELRNTDCPGQSYYDAIDTINDYALFLSNGGDIRFLPGEAAIAAPAPIPITFEEDYPMQVVMCIELGRTVLVYGADQFVEVKNRPAGVRPDLPTEKALLQQRIDTGAIFPAWINAAEFTAKFGA